MSELGLRLATYSRPGYGGSTPREFTRGLQLVTCGGAFDSQTGYQSNVVVYTTLISRDRLVR